MAGESDITFVTTFKGFDSPRDALCQCSAAFSWRLEKCQVLVIGDDYGVRELCQDAGFALVPKVRRADALGLKSPCPMLRDIFRIACNTVSTTYFCLINADIILSRQFHSKLGTLLFHKSDPFVTGVRQNVKLDKEITSVTEFDAMWRLAHGVYQNGGGTDFFALSRNLARRILRVMPDYVMGATAWDNWLHWAALTMSSSPINATLRLPTMHPHHDYKGLSSASRSGIKGHPAVIHNQRLFYRRNERAAITNSGWKIL